MPILLHDVDAPIECDDLLDYLDETFLKLKLIPDDDREDIKLGLDEKIKLHLGLRVLTRGFVMPGFCHANVLRHYVYTSNLRIRLTARRRTREKI